MTELVVVVAPEFSQSQVSISNVPADVQTNAVIPVVPIFPVQKKQFINDDALELV